jgi:hypothetical protein
MAGIQNFVEFADDFLLLIHHRQELRPIHAAESMAKQHSLSVARQKCKTSVSTWATI